MVRGVRLLSVYESPNRRPLDRAAGRIGWIGDGADEAPPICAGTLFRLGVARARAMDYRGHFDWPPAQLALSQTCNLQLSALEQRFQPARNLVCNGQGSPSPEAQHLVHSPTNHRVVVDAYNFDPTFAEVESCKKVARAFGVDIADKALRSRMSAAIRALNNSADALFHAARCHVIHRSPESVFVSQP